jgi:hypothetical protein
MSYIQVNKFPEIRGGWVQFGKAIITNIKIR